jgi:N12 class adenine-specific DNA methylase
LHEVRLGDAATPPAADEAGAGDEPSADSTPERRHLRRGVVEINEYFVAHPELVLGDHAQRRGIYGPGLSYTCMPRETGVTLESLLDAALARLPSGVLVPAVRSEDAEEQPDDEITPVGTAADGATIKEGSFLIGKGGRLCQIINGTPLPVAIRSGNKGEGITSRAGKIIRALLPIRDAIRDVLRAQATGRPWAQAQVRLRCAYSTFIRYYGPINHTVVTTLTDPDTGEEREQHRRPNLAPFADDPDSWLVASIEDYDLESGIARKGAIFEQRVISPPATPLIISAGDALAVTLNDLGHVEPERLGELLDCEPDDALRQLDTAVFRNPMTGFWETADTYLSGPVRTKLAAAEAAATLDPQYERNVIALREAQPKDIPPSGITARLGAPWLPTTDIEAFAVEVMGTEVRIFHTEEVATWSVDGSRFIGTAAGTSEWGTSRRHAGALLHDALNSATPQIFDVETENGVERRVLNPEATEAAKEKLTKIKTAFEQ